MAHVIVSEGLENRAYIAERCDLAEFTRWQAFTGKEALLEGDGRRFAEIGAERAREAA